MIILNPQSVMSRRSGAFRSLGLVFDCGDFTTYSESSIQWDAGTRIRVTTPVRERTRSVKCPVDADKHAIAQAEWYWYVSPTLISNYRTDWLYVSIYFDTLTYIRTGGSSVQVYLFNLSGAYKYWNFDKVNLSAGWNLLKADLENSTGTFGVFDFGAVNRIRLLLFETVGNTTDFDVYLESAFIAR